MMKKNLVPVDFIRFIVVGVGSNVLNYAIYLVLCWLGFPVSAASSLGYLAGLINSYLMGRKWVFKKDKPKNSGKLDPLEILRFCLIYSVGGIGMVCIIAGLNRWGGVDYRLSWFFGATFAFLNNYLGSKRIVFKAGKKDGN